MGISLGLKSVHEERRLMKIGLGAGLFVMTVALAVVNGTGAWVSTGSLAFTALAIGAEISLVFMFSLVVLSETRGRQFVGFLIFVGLAWFCVENGKAGVRHWMPNVFVGNPAQLEALADLNDEEALKLDSLPADTQAEANADRRAVRDEIAALRAEFDLMTSETRIMEAQRHLTALGLYTGRIDGIRAELTETAMRQRGESIRRRLEVLQIRADESSGLTVVETALAPAQERRVKAIELRRQAAEVREREWWAQILLVIAEAARSFGVWAFLMAGTRKTARVNVEAPGEGQMDADERKAIDKVLETMTQREEGDTAPLTRAEIGRLGGLAAAHARQSKVLDRRIPVDPPEVAV